MDNWKEYNNGVLNNMIYFYNCYRTNDPVEINNIQDLFVMSYVAEGVIEKAGFWHFCQNEILLDILDRGKMYMIAVEQLKNPNSRIENYKKCWKKISEKYDLSGIQLSEELRCQKGGEVFYAGIAKTGLSNLSSMLKIMGERNNKYFFFISDKDYFDQYQKIDKFILPYLRFDKFYDIDNINAINICTKNHDIACRYGWDSIGIELDFIMNIEDIQKYCKNENKLNRKPTSRCNGE